MDAANFDGITFPTAIIGALRHGRRLVGHSHASAKLKADRNRACRAACKRILRTGNGTVAFKAGSAYDLA